MGGGTYLVGLWVVKKAAVFGLGSLYGWPRVYRRVMEGNARINGRNTVEYAKVRGVVQKAMRLPREMKKASPPYLAPLSTSP